MQAISLGLAPAPGLQNMTAFVKKSTTIPPATASWLPVTSTAGWGYAVQEVTLGLFRG